MNDPHLQVEEYHILQSFENELAPFERLSDYKYEELQPSQHFPQAQPPRHFPHPQPARPFKLSLPMDLRDHQRTENVEGQNEEWHLSGNSFEYREILDANNNNRKTNTPDSDRPTKRLKKPHKRMPGMTSQKFKSPVANKTASPPFDEMAYLKKRC